MDYEKKYEVALERAREALNDGTISSNTIAYLQDIFPELKESEDEKIRKRILLSLEKDLMATKNSGCNTQDLEQCIAWLEKQGDKDKLIKELGEYKVKYTQEVLENHINSMGNKDDERLRKTTIAFLKDFVDQGYENAVECIEWLEKQGEQKPFDYENANIQQKDFAPQEDAPRYSIGDVLCDKSCTTLDKDAQPNYEIVDIRNGLYICDKGYIPISQQDEYELVAKKIEQKPAWSEEDECYMVECINAIATKDGWSFEEKRKTKHWLKSLKDRYTWKPSDEQMITLRHVISGCSYDIEPLVEIEEHLKKLREE